jgi:hypothetical protein
MDRPSDCNINSLQWGSLWLLEVLLSSPEAAQQIVSKLRGAGSDAFRYLLDHPLSMLGDLGYETGSQATRIAALVWGRDEDGGGLVFKQQDIDTIVKAARGFFWPMTAQSGEVILNLCVSDKNKELLLDAEDFVQLLLDSLLMHEPQREHPAVQ